MPTKTVSFKNNAINANATAAAFTVGEAEVDEEPLAGLARIPANEIFAAGAADDVDPSDITLPKIKLLQGTSDKKLLQQHGFGALVLKDAITLARPAIEGKSAVTATMVFCRLLSKSYAEKPKKYGDPSGYASSLVEVEQLNGTTDWRESRENPRASSTKAWFQQVANCLVLVAQPDGVPDDHFPFEAGGKRYTPAIYSVKSFAYEAFFKTIATAKATGELRKYGYASKYIEFVPEIKAGKGNAEFVVPGIKFGDSTPDDVRALAAQF